MDSIAVLSAWAEQQSERELAMLRLAMAYHMSKIGIAQVTLSVGELTDLVNHYHCHITLDAHGGMIFTLNARTGAAPAAPA